ncbi:UNVERIFIED_CONTAM: putative ribonuclease H protein [Sesamum angustifolium]|uniref:Ribonuclease H protein n=1 Tax=Sesamum angustifolium TaxID=2727405 RepID=A0AAW2RLP9_9LAMI
MRFIFCQTVPRAPSIVRWRTPSPSWFKLNTDGSSFGNPGLARAAGIIRDSAGHVHLAYHVALGTGTSVLAELIAVWQDLELALTYGLAPLVVEVDATAVITLLQSRVSGKWKTGSPSPSPGMMMVSRLGPGVFGGGFVAGFGNNGNMWGRWVFFVSIERYLRTYPRDWELNATSSNKKSEQPAFLRNGFLLFYWGFD